MSGARSLGYKLRSLLELADQLLARKTKNMVGKNNCAHILNYVVSRVVCSIFLYHFPIILNVGSDRITDETGGWWLVGGGRYLRTYMIFHF